MKKTSATVLVLLLGLLISSPGFVSDNGNFAIAANEDSVTVDVSEIAARSLFFLIFDPDGQLLEVIGNPYLKAQKRAGDSVVNLLAQKGVTFIVAGQFGANMVNTMQNMGIRYLEFHGSVARALEKALEEKKQ